MDRVQFNSTVCYTIKQLIMNCQCQRKSDSLTFELSLTEANYWRRWQRRWGAVTISSVGIRLFTIWTPDWLTSRTDVRNGNRCRWRTCQWSKCPRLAMCCALNRNSRAAIYAACCRSAAPKRPCHLHYTTLYNTDEFIILNNDYIVYSKGNIWFLLGIYSGILKDPSSTDFYLSAIKKRN